MPSSNQAIFSLYACTFFLALNGIFSKVLPLDTFSITFARSAVAICALLVLLYWQNNSLGLTSSKQYIGIYALGVVMGLHWATYFYSMQISSVAIGMLSLFSYPIITVLLEPLLNRQRPGLVDIFAVLLLFVGVFVIVADDLWDLKQGSSSLSVIKGLSWGLISAVLFSLRNIMQKKYYSEVPSGAVMVHQLLAIGIMFLPFVDSGQLLAFQLGDWVTLVLLGLLSTALAHTLLSFSIRGLPAKTVAMISSLTPLMGVLMAWAYLGEIPSVLTILGGAIILSVALFESMRHTTLDKG